MQSRVQVQWGVRVPLRDGVCLSGNLYLPDGRAEPAPAILQMTPYTAQIAHARGMYVAEHGYPFLVVDVRGRGNSDGVFRPNINESKDGFDLVEWLATQPYCNGKVAMWGGSYGGHVQWTTAREFPPHLATIVPTAPPCFAVDFPIRNNIAYPYWIQWLTLVWGRTLQDKLFWNNQPYWNDLFRQLFESGSAFRDLDVLAGFPSPVFQEWVQHPHCDTYWDSYNPTREQYAALSLPILTITGVYDGDQAGALAHYREHTQRAPEDVAARHYLVIGPWDHAGTGSPAREFGGLKFGPDSMVDVAKLHLDWYAWTMQQGPKPEFLRKRVAYYVIGAEKWRYADSLAEVTERSVPFYLQSSANPCDVFASGSLHREPSAQGGNVDTYRHDPRDVSLAKLESSIDPGDLTDQRMIYASSGRQLIYHTAPFDNDIEITGFFRLSVWLAIDQPDTDFRVLIYEIAADGTSVFLSVDSMRARYRESMRIPKLIETRDPLQYDFERFTYISKRVQKGHRLRLVVGPINSIYAQRNYNTGGDVATETIEDARAVTVKLFHDAARRSALYVPFGHSDD